MTDTSPFQPGARIAAVTYNRWANSKTYREARVAKVYKGGNFVLEDDRFRRQWRPCSPGGVSKEWRAYRTGSSRYDSETLFVWDDALEAEIAAERARQDLTRRWSAAQARLERIRPQDATGPLIEAVEAAIEAFDTPSPAEGCDRSGNTSADPSGGKAS